MLLEKITQTTIAYLKNKIASGVEVIQLFDSWAGILSPDQFRKFSLPYLNQIAEAIDEKPVILFARGAHHSLKEITQANTAIGLDWTIDAAKIRRIIGDGVVVQGNLDPCQLYGTEEEVRMATIKMLKELGPRHIANLGHGVYPDTPLDRVKTFVNTVRDYRYSTN